MGEYKFEVSVQMPREEGTCIANLIGRAESLFVDPAWEVDHVLFTEERRTKTCYITFKGRRF